MTARLKGRISSAEREPTRQVVGSPRDVGRTPRQFVVGCYRRSTAARPVPWCASSCRSELCTCEQDCDRDGLALDFARMGVIGLGAAGTAIAALVGKYNVGQVCACDPNRRARNHQARTDPMRSDRGGISGADARSERQDCQAMTNNRRASKSHGLGITGTDHEFDRLVPSELRHLSNVHWTPVSVAIRATSLLDPKSGSRVLDIGAGVGKQCAVGALSSRAHWFGIEQHAVMVSAAKRLAATLGVADRTTFIHGDAFSIDWTDYDGLYLYNPFKISSAQLGSERERHRDIARVQERFEAMGSGTRIVMLHGFGGVMPSSYELVHQERLSSSELDLVLWTKRFPRQARVRLS